MADVFDDFNRADAATLGTAPTGQTWVNNTGGAIGISANKAVVSVQGSDAIIHIDAAAANANYQVTLNAGTATQGGLGFRKTDELNFWVLQLVGGSDLYTRKFVAGVYTDLINPIASIADGDIMRVECLGDTITVKYNGVTIRTVTDAFNNTATKGGLLCRAGAAYEDFSITGVGVGGGGATAGARRAYRRRNLLFLP